MFLTRTKQMKITEDLIIASNNKHKVVEIKQILGDFFKNIYTLSDKKIISQIPGTKSFRECSKQTNGGRL